MLEELATEYGRRLREEKWTIFSRFFPPRRGERVLDVGVSHLHGLPNENYFLERYPFPDQVTAVGITDLEPLRAVFPSVSFVQADGRDLPFETSSFDVVHSNAVVEHVGPHPEQRKFVEELTRVSARGLITTPNRWFPLEAHTRLPLVHWLPRPAMLRAFDLAQRPEHGIWLLSRRKFEALFPEGVSLETIPNRIAGIAATISIVFDRSRTTGSRNSDVRR